MDNNDTSVQFVNKIFKYMKNGMPIETFAEKFQYSLNEINGIVELCNLYEKRITICEENGVLVFKKNKNKSLITSKLAIDNPNLFHNQLCIISDTHFGNIHQQLHLVNEVYKEAYYRGIKTVLHAGDLLDGNYLNRPENPRQQFLHGFDEQAGYVVDMYPKIDGITTYYILGSHDETHYKNDQATANAWITRCRKDMKYLGQDTGELLIDDVKIVLDHPGGGSAQYVSYKPQKRIEIIDSHYKPKVLLIGHYHKSYYFNYRNIQCILVPSLCDKTQFQQKQGISNVIGAYFLDIYSDQKGNIQYLEPEEILFDKKDIWDEPGKDKLKVRKLRISKGRY